MKLRKVYACILTLCMLVSMLPAFAADTDASCTHKWTEKVIKEANCTQTGLVKKTCELCGDFEYEKTPFKHGEGKEVVKEATCTKPETVGLYCEKCGELIGKVQEVGKALGHDLGKGTEKKADCAARIASSTPASAAAKPSQRRSKAAKRRRSTTGKRRSFPRRARRRATKQGSARPAARSKRIRNSRSTRTRTLPSWAR